MERPGLLELARSSLEDGIIHTELLHPKLYAFLLSVALALAMVVVAGVFLSFDSFWANALAGVFLLVLVLSVACLFLLSDLCIVEMVRESGKQGINKAVCLERAKARIVTYALCIIPVVLARTLFALLLGGALVFAVPALSIAPYSDLAVQGASVIVDVVLSVFFVFLVQTIMFEARGVMETLNACIQDGRSAFMLFLKYVVFRSFLGGVADLLFMLPLLFFLLKLGYPVADLEGLGMSSALILAGLVVVYSGLKMVVLDSFLVVMDTRAYFSWVPARAVKARSKARKN